MHAIQQYLQWCVRGARSALSWGTCSLEAWTMGPSHMCSCSRCCINNIKHYTQQHSQQTLPTGTSPHHTPWPCKQHHYSVPAPCTLAQSALCWGTCSSGVYTMDPSNRCSCSRFHKIVGRRRCQAGCKGGRRKGPCPLGGCTCGLPCHWDTCRCIVKGHMLEFSISICPACCRQGLCPLESCSSALPSAGTPAQSKLVAHVQETGAQKETGSLQGGL